MLRNGLPAVLATLLAAPLYLTHAALNPPMTWEYSALVSSHQGQSEARSTLSHRVPGEADRGLLTWTYVESKQDSSLTLEGETLAVLGKATLDVDDWTRRHLENPTVTRQDLPSGSVRIKASGIEAYYHPTLYSKAAGVALAALGEQGWEVLSVHGSTPAVDPGGHFDPREARTFHLRRRAR